MVDNLRTQVLKWFVETGYMDGYGMGHWNGTTESVEVESESDAIALQNKWLEQGKLIRTHWGELRPNSGYGIFRIRSSWVDIQNPLTDHTEAQAAEIERLRGVLERGLSVAKEIEKACRGLRDEAQPMTAKDAARKMIAALSND